MQSRPGFTTTGLFLRTPGERPLVERSEPLAGVPPVVVALIDAFAEGSRARDERDAVDADRLGKQKVVDQLLLELESVRVDQTAKQRLLCRQDEELRAVRDDQDRKSSLITCLGHNP